MRETLQKCLGFVPPSKRRRWFGLVVLAILVSAMEASGAILVFGLLGLLTSPDGGLTLPALGDVRQLLPRADRDELLLLATGGVGLFFVLRGALVLGQAYLQNRVVQNAGAVLSARLLQTYLRMPYEFHLRHHSAELLRTAHESVNTIIGAVFLPAIAVTAEALLVLAILAVLLASATTATLLSLAVLAPVVVGVVKLLQPRMAALGQEQLEMHRQSLQSLQEGLQGVRDVKLYQAEAYFGWRYERARSRLARTFFLRGTLAEVPRIALETALILFILVFVTTAILATGSLTQTLPVLGLFAYAALRIVPSLNRIISNLNNLRFARAAIEQVDADLHAERGEDEAARVSGEESPFLNSLELRDVMFRYPATETPALRSVSLTIRRGELIGIVGPTGGGKSTLIDLLLGLIRPSSGEVLVDGVSLRGRERAWQKQLGVVPQSVLLMDDTLWQNIAFGIQSQEINPEHLARAVRLAQLEEFIATLPDGLDTVVGERGVRLSGGQRQRVAIARALYRDPSVLVLDEGTSALDTRTESALMRAIAAIRDAGMTVLVVAHRLSTVRACDRIIVIEGGSIVGEGRFEELLEQHEGFRALVKATSGSERYGPAG